MKTRIVITHRWLKLTGLLFLWVFLLGGHARGAEPPNIVIILADDMGVGSVNCYGAPTNLVRTPHIDRLAREGRRFLDASSPASVCSPTRYALLTGRYCWRTRLQYSVLDTDEPLLIETNRLTLASLLQRQGYRTAAIGKWHLGYGHLKADYTHELKPGPLEIGFDYHFGVPAVHGDYTGIFVENHGVAGLRSTNLAPFGKGYYLGRPYHGIDAPQRIDEQVTDVLTDKAVAWLEKQVRRTPFFLCFTPAAIHEPTTPSARTKGTSGCGPYGDFIHDLDNSVGGVLDALDRLDLARNTLVIFTSDNGGVLMTSGDRPEAQAYAAGMRVSGPWRGSKCTIYEGGFRVPFLARWPGRIPAGTVCNDTINLVDLLATSAAILGQKLPPATEAAEDSNNILPALLGQPSDASRRPAMVLHCFYGSFAIRQGPWKWIEGKVHPQFQSSQFAALAATYKPQLYNLQDDPREEHDLQTRYPEVARRLAALLEACRTNGFSRR